MKKNYVARILSLLFTFMILVHFFSVAQNISAPIKNSKSYFKRVVNLIEKNYYYSDSINLPSYIDVFKKKYDFYKNPDSSYSILKRLLFSLKGNHSGFLTAKELGAIQDPDSMNYPTGKIINHNIGYLYIPTCMAKESFAIVYADSIIKIIKSLDSNLLKGWIIDLRDNQGGNSFPMIAGLNTFFNEGDLCYSIDKNNIKTSFRIKAGGVEQYYDQKISYSFRPFLKYRLKNNNLNIAVLINKGTASAGERTAICLKSISTVKLIGEASGGFTTGTRVFVLEDGSLVYILNSITMDKYGKVYDREIQPDIYVEGNKDDYIREAMEWINKR